MSVETSIIYCQNYIELSHSIFPGLVLSYIYIYPSLAPNNDQHNTETMDEHINKHPMK